MRTQTLHKRELFARALRAIGLGVFAVFGITALLLAHTPVKSLADTNSTINFQARLQTSAGAIAPDGNYNVEFKLYNVDTGGSALWTEDYAYGSPDHRIRVANGYLSANLGSLTAFSGINWDQDLYLTMNIGGATTTPSWDGEMNPRLKVTSVPYAFRAGQLAQYNSTTGYTSTLSIAQPTGGNQTFQIQDQGAGGTYNLLTTNVADNSYIQLQASTPGTAQTGNINISGKALVSTLQASTSVLTTLLDTPSSGGTLAVGTTNATGGINLNQNTTIASGKTLTVQGTTSITSVSDSSAFSVTGTTRMFTVDTSSGRVTVGTVGGCSSGAGRLCVSQSNIASGNVVNLNSALVVTSTGATTNVNQNVLLSDTSSSQANTDNMLVLDSTATTNSSATVNSIIAQVPTGQAGNFIQLQNGSTTELTVTNTGALSVNSTINSVSGYKFNGTSGSTTTCSSGNVLQNAVVQGGIITSGTCVANGGGVAPTLQNVYDNSATSPQIALSTASGGGLVIKDASTTVGGNLFVIQNNAASTNYFAVTTSGASVSGALSVGSTINSNTFSSSSLTFGAGSAASIAAATGQNLSVDSGSGGALSLGTSSNSVTLGSAGHTTTIGSTSLSGSQTLINGGTSGTAISIQSGSGGTISVGSSGVGNTLQIGNTTGAVSQTINVGNNATASSTTTLTVGSTIGSSTTTIQAGSGGINLSGSTTVTGSLNATSGFAYNGTSGITMTACTGGQVLTNIGISGGIITSVGSCVANGAASPTLQDVYNNSTDGVIAESGSKGLTVKDASSTVGNILQIQNSSATSTYFSVTANGAQAAAFDAQPSSALTIGGANATSVTIGSGSVTTTFSGNVTIASGKTFSLAGAETLTATSSTALKIQDGSNNVLLTADTSAMQVVVGSTSNGVILSASGISLVGTAQKTKSIVLMPEFGGAVLDAGSGSNNTGTMTSGYDSTAKANYYKWTTTQGTNQSYDIVLQVAVPSDFAAWASSNAFAVNAYTSNTTNGTITVQQVYDSSGTADTNFSTAQSATPGSTTTWTTTNFSLSNSNTYTAGGIMTIRIRLQSPTSGDVRLGKIVLNYKNAY